jgi:hypothetical protein
MFDLRGLKIKAQGEKPVVDKGSVLCQARL